MRSIQLVTLLLLAANASAHDFWIEPTSWTPVANELVFVHFRSGDGFMGEAVPRNSARIERFVVRDERGEQAVAGIDGRDPAGAFRAADVPCASVIYQGKPKEAELSPARFSRYMREEGLETQLQRDVRRKVTDRYSRSAVTLLRSNRPCEQFQPSDALALQIVPALDPSTADSITFTLLYESKPARDVTMIAYSRSTPAKQQRAVTDDEGRVTFHLHDRGAWLVKAVKISPDGKDRFRSHWASLTFSR